MKSILKTVFLFITHIIMMIIVARSYDFYEKAIISNSLNDITLYYILITITYILYFLFIKYILINKVAIKVCISSLFLPIIYSLNLIIKNQTIIETVSELSIYMLIINIIYVTWIQNKQIYLNK